MSTSKLRYRLTEVGDKRFVTNPNDRFVGKALECYGEWAPTEIDLLSQFLKPGMNVIECGANIGAQSVYLGELIAPDGQLYCFEPCAIIFSCSMPISR